MKPADYLIRLRPSNPMKIPRWTVYPALAVIGTLIITAVPHTADLTENGERVEGSAQRARATIVERATGGKLEEIQQTAKKRLEEIMEPAQPGQDE